MATYNQFGNSIPSPAVSLNNPSSVDAELMYSMVGYVQKGVTLKPGQGVLLAGTFLDQDTASKQYVKTTTPGNVKGILRQTTDTGTDATAQVWQANILYGGIVKYNMLVSANSGVAITSTILNGQVNTIVGFFNF